MNICNVWHSIKTWTLHFRNKNTWKTLNTWGSRMPLQKHTMSIISLPNLVFSSPLHVFAPWMLLAKNMLGTIFVYLSLSTAFCLSLSIPWIQLQFLWKNSDFQRKYIFMYEGVVAVWTTVHSESITQCFPTSYNTEIFSPLLDWKERTCNMSRGTSNWLMNWG